MVCRSDDLLGESLRRCQPECPRTLAIASVFSLTVGATEDMKRQGRNASMYFPQLKSMVPRRRSLPQSSALHFAFLIFA
jgi:hypothetical protein